MSMTFRLFVALLPAFLLHAAPAVAELPIFNSDGEADQWLRKNSGHYREMAATLDQAGGYDIVPTTVYPRSMMVMTEGRRPSIQLNKASQGPTRLTLMIFEFCNATQAGKFQEIAAEVQAGRIKDASEYAILHMLIEMESLHLHHRILEDLYAAGQDIPPAMFQCFRPEVIRFSSYELPPAYDYIRSRQGSDYRHYYEQWFRDHLPKEPK